MSNAVLLNFAGGETSPKSRGRFDLAWYFASCRKLLNFIPEITGPARYRPAFRHSHITRGGKTARIIPIQLNFSQPYLLEFTDSKLRFYKNNRLLTTAKTTLTNITQADPAVATFASATLFSNGDEVILADIVGMTEFNGRPVKLANKSGSTFELTDVITGNDIDSSAFAAYSSGGTVDLVLEIDSPYLESELVDVMAAQSNDAVYLTHFRRAPRKVTADAADNFVIATFSRTNDPLVSAASIIFMTRVTQGTQTILHFNIGSTIVYGAVYTVTAVVGMVELNGNSFRFIEPTEPTAFPTLPSAILTDPVTGAEIDSTSFGAYSNDTGQSVPDPDNPIAAALYESRLVFLGTDQRRAVVLGSQAPDSTDGSLRLEDFTGGTEADKAVFFTLASNGGQIPTIAWGLGTSKYLFIGTFGGLIRLSGGGLEQPVTPSSVNAKQVDTFGCEATPAAFGERVFYIQRGGQALRATQIAPLGLDELKSQDMTINAEHITESGLKRVVFQRGRPNIVWVLRNDGILAGMTVEQGENVTGWHRHKVGGVDAKVIDIAALPRSDNNDQLWIVVERTVNGITQRSTEFLADDVLFPDEEDFFTDLESKAADLEQYKNAVYRRQEQYIHVDAAGTFNGSDRGLVAEATLTPGALTGASITFTASQAVFAAADVGSELWKKPKLDTGIGKGRATIKTFNSPTEVVCDIDEDFDATTAIVAGDWYIAAKTITGLHHLEGETVAVQIDGGVHSDGQGTAGYPVVTVANGKITLDVAAAVVHVGFPYEGLLQTHNLEMGGLSGPAQAKPRNIVKLFIRFLSSLGGRYGTDIYRLRDIESRPAGAKTDRPSPVFSGFRDLLHEGGWSDRDSAHEKFVFVSQKLPLPCVVQSIDLQYDTGDE